MVVLTVCRLVALQNLPLLFILSLKNVLPARPSVSFIPHLH